MTLRRLAAPALVVLALSLAACGGGGAAPTCTDGARNGDETAADCGGPTCQPCADGLACADDRDCRSARCAGGACATPACNDLVRNGLETGIDCGGACAPCADGLACAVDGDCQSGRCAGQVCLKAIGAGCGAAGECAGGQCVDGVCCESACAGTCEACNLPGRFGHCDPVPDGEDPAAECAAEAPATCGQDGACSGSRTCRKHATGTSCEPAACLDAGTAQPGATCDGAGACVAPAAVVCSPLTCDATAGACRTACADSTQCAAGYGCAAGGGCLKLDGQVCTIDAECGSGFCTDGVCCGTRCGGTCEACDQPGRAGSCDPIPAGQDPADECAATAAATCGTSGACSGSRSCALWSGATTCAGASCDSATVSRPASLCSGGGACQSQGTIDCAPLTCDGTTGLCRTTCTPGGGECAAGYGCFAGACKKLSGAACAIDAECGSGFCTDGVCCGTRCGGTCEACNLFGRAGICDPVPAGQDPANECADQGAASCGTNGSCSGTRTCATYAAGTVCAAASCSSGSAVAASRCDGSGACVLGASTSCGAYACNPATGLCRTACNPGGGECAAGYDCFAGACMRATGAACAADVECGSGYCTDGVCCGTRCLGTCQACNLPGNTGSCTLFPAGTPAVAECPVDACHPGTCNGTGGCAVALDATPCATGAVCQAGACVDLNECTSGSATCDANATCTNTAPGYTCACKAGFLGDGFSCRRPVSCAELHSASPGSPSGLYTIDPDGPGGLAEFTVSCDMTTDGGGWTVFQRRQDATDFYRTYAEYQAGFGSPGGSHWLGLDRLVALTASTTAPSLRAELVLASSPGTTWVETYDTFRVGIAPDYVLTVTGPAGTAGDSMAINSTHGFSTRDRTATGENPGCASAFQSGWWFQACTLANPNGPFVPGTSGSLWDRMFWFDIKRSYDPLSFAELKLR